MLLTPTEIEQALRDLPAWTTDGRSLRRAYTFADFPAAAVARDQLKFSVAELSTHDNQRVTKALNDGLQAALTGAKTPEAAMKDAQREADLARQLGATGEK